MTDRQKPWESAYLDARRRVLSLVTDIDAAQQLVKSGQSNAAIEALMQIDIAVLDASEAYSFIEKEENSDTD